MVDDNISDIIKNGENEFVEFKQSFNSESIESLSAFANTKGGFVYVGVKDNGEIVGVNLNQESIKNWINEIKSKTQPSIIPDFDVLIEGGKQVLVLQMKLQ